MKYDQAKNRRVYATLGVSLRAVDSIFWHTKQPRGRKHPSDYEDNLQDQGYSEFARCPEAEFKPDLKKLGHKNIKRVAKLISDLDDSQVRIFTWLLANQDSLHQRGYTFGQRVYVNLSSPRQDYLDCYFSAYMLAYEDTIEGKQFFYVTGSLDSITGSLMLLPKDSILDEKQFLRKQAKLMDSGRVKSPKKAVRFKRPHRDSTDISLDVPTIDTVKDELEDTPKIKNTNRTFFSLDSNGKNKFIIT